MIEKRIEYSNSAIFLCIINIIVSVSILGFNANDLISGSNSTKGFREVVLLVLTLYSVLSVIPINCIGANFFNKRSFTYLSVFFYLLVVNLPLMFFGGNSIILSSFISIVVLLILNKLPKSNLFCFWYNIIILLFVLSISLFVMNI